MLILTPKNPWNGNINVRKSWFEIREYDLKESEIKKFISVHRPIGGEDINNPKWLCTL